MTNWSFEPFDRLNDNFSATITKYGFMYFNSVYIKFLKTFFNLGEHVYIELFYDKFNNCIGFKLVNQKKTRRTLKLSSTNPSTRSVCLSKFFNVNGIDIIKVCGKYVLTKELVNDDIGEVWIINLNKKGK